MRAPTFSASHIETRAHLYARLEGPHLLRMTIGIVFLWFGALKLLGRSPADHIVHAMLPFIPQSMVVRVVGCYECVLGIGLIMGRFMKLTLSMFWLQVLLTLSLMVLQPKLVFQNSIPPFLTMEGEFVVKNIVLLAAGVVMVGYFERVK